MKPLHWDEINPATGTPYPYDHPNVRWGFVLEEGDEGFVPWTTTPLSPKPKTKSNIMKRQNYYPLATGQQIQWLNNFAAKLAGHAATLGISPAECAARIADARWVVYIIGSWLPAVRAWNKACTEAAALAQSPDGPNMMALPVFIPPPLPEADPAPGGLPAVVPVEEGALDRIFATVQVIKEAEGYNASIAEDLRVLGAAATGPDFDTIQPTLKASVTAAGVRLLWGWEGYSDWLDACEIEVDRGDTQGWRNLIFDTDPNFTDAAAHPSTLTKWKYRAIYRVGESRVGQWSAEASVTVGG